MGLMNINGMGDMFEMYGSNKKMGMDEMRLPSNLAPIGSPGPFGVIEMGGMFTIFKVRDNLTSYTDPGWYQHPPGTVAEAVNIDEMAHLNMPHHYNNCGMQNLPRSTNIVSWFSEEQHEKEPSNQAGVDWMQSKPEDSMGGHIIHRMDDKGTIQNTNQMQHMAH